VNALASPLEVAVRQPRTCATCTTHDCLAGNETSRGCELELFAPRKAGNLDCTFCLDCVRACPHDNIGILATAPGQTLLRDPDRSSLGRLSRRPDVAALALVVVFGAFATAAAMVGPVAQWQQQLATRLGFTSVRPVTTGAFAVALVIAPAALALLAAALGRRIARIDLPLRTLVLRFALALVPLGLAMWAAHFLLHLVAGWRSIVPVLQGFAPGLLGQPNWALCLPGIAPDSLLGLEMLLLDAGLLATLWVGWRIATNTVRARGPALALLGPWALLATALWLGGVWSFVQPMAMRGLASPG
jgi:ferredoxin